MRGKPAAIRKSGAAAASEPTAIDSAPIRL